MIIKATHKNLPDKDPCSFKFKNKMQLMSSCMLCFSIQIGYNVNGKKKKIREEK